MKTMLVLTLACGLAAAAVCSSTCATAAQDDSLAPAMTGNVTDSSGRVIATSKFFGEGTTKISFDRNQRLVVRDADGKVIAGFEYVAVDPKKSKFTEVFLLQYEDGGKKDWLLLEHKVARMTFRQGKFTVAEPDTKLLTSFWKGDEQMSVNFKEVKNDVTKDGPVLNRLIVQSPEGDTFEFEIEDSRPTYHYLKRLKGDLVSYLKGKGGRSGKESSTKK